MQEDALKERHLSCMRLTLVKEFSMEMCSVTRTRVAKIRKSD